MIVRRRPPISPGKHGVSEATLYNWKATYGGMDFPETKRLRQFEDESSKLKKLLAEQMLDAAALRELLAKKWLGPPPSAKLSCYKSRRPPDTELRTRLRELANVRKRLGYRRLRQQGEPI